MVLLSGIIKLNNSGGGVIMAVKSGSSVDEAALLIERFTDVRKTVIAERNARLEKLDKKSKMAYGNSGGDRATFRSGQQSYHGRTQETQKKKKKVDRRRPI
jgi:hypothetical protein